MGIIDFLKMHPELYNAPQDEAVFITPPKLSYLVIAWHGSSITDEGFQNAMQLLIGVGFSMKCNLKFNPPENFVDYIMPPIEVIWYDTDKKKTEWKWKLLLMQPDYITEEMVNKSFDIAKKKNPDQITAKISLLQLNEGLCIQTMHTGSYEFEKTTVTFLRKEAKKNGYEIGNDLHEVFINDPRRTIAKKLQTIIRFSVKKIPWKEKVEKPAKKVKALTKTATKKAPVKPTATKKTAPTAKKPVITKKPAAKKKLSPKKKISKTLPKKVIKKKTTATTKKKSGKKKK